MTPTIRRARWAGVILVLAAALGGCGPDAGQVAAPSSPPTAPSSTAPSAEPLDGSGEPVAPTGRDATADARVLDLVEWVDGDDGAPTLRFEPPLGVSGPTARLVEDGDGAAIRETDSVTFQYAMFAGDSGELEYSTYEADRPQTVVLGGGSMSQTFVDALVGRHVGARVVFATLDSSGNTVSDYLVTMFMAVTVVDARAILSRASGTPVPPVAGLPAVHLDESGAPSVEIPATAPPDHLVAQDLVEGAGPPVSAGQTAVLQLTGWLWDTGEEFDTTWGTGTLLVVDLSTESTIAGLVHGLEGKHVGSQVLLVVPPSLGLGDQATGNIPAGSTLVYVVDVLDVH